MTKDQREAIEAAFAARDTVALTLRLPRDLHGRLVELAELQDRSLHSAIVAALRAHSAVEWAKAYPTPRKR